MFHQAAMRRAAAIAAVAGFVLAAAVGGQVYEIWADPYNGPQSGTDIAMDVAVDQAGNPVVVGWTAGTSGPNDVDYLIIKYLPDGPRRCVNAAASVPGIRGVFCALR